MSLSWTGTLKIYKNQRKGICCILLVKQKWKYNLSVKMLLKLWIFCDKCLKRNKFWHGITNNRTNSKNVHCSSNSSSGSRIYASHSYLGIYLVAYKEIILVTFFLNY